MKYNGSATHITLCIDMKYNGSATYITLCIDVGTGLDEKLSRSLVAALARKAQRRVAQHGPCVHRQVPFLRTCQDGTCVSKY